MTGLSSAPPSASRRVLGDALSFGLPALSFAHFTYIGEVYLAEILAVFVLLDAVASGKKVRDKRIRRLCVLLMLWLLSAVVTDLIRHTEPSNYLRGWFSICFAGIDLLAIYFLTANSTRRLTLAAYGLALSGILGFAIQPSVFARSEIWKFGVGYSLTLLILLISGRFLRPRLVTVSAAGLAVLNLVLGFRSLAGFCALTVVLLLFMPMTKPGRASRRKAPLAQQVFVLGAASVTALAVLGFYADAASKGLLGDAAARTYRMQSGELGAPGVLLGGRTEVFFAGPAILDNPIIGSGSYAERTRENDAVGAQHLSKLGFPRPPAPLPGDADLLPTHSHLLGAWVHAGIGGAIFWLSTLALLANVQRHIEPIRHRHLYPIALLLLVSTTWDILFSPFGAARRLGFAFAIVLLLSMSQRRKERPSHDLRDPAVVQPKGFR